MFNHITPPSGGLDHNEQAAEPPNSRRFADQRGIALQTVIIMVVLLAIAGAVAAVLFSRAQDATTELESQSVNSSAYAARTATACAAANGTWTSGNASGEHLARWQTANNNFTDKGFDKDGDGTSTNADASHCIPKS